MNIMQCKECIFCKWSCPGYMCTNPKHPDFEVDSDYPLKISPFQVACELIQQGESDYKRFMANKN